jgi:hypothetical protein
VNRRNQILFTSQSPGEIDKPLANLTTMRKKTQISKIRNEKGEITRSTKESSVTTFRIYIPIKWKILKKQANFSILVTMQK